MKVRAISVVILTLAVLAAGYAGQNSHGTLGSAIFHVGGSPLDLDIFHFKAAPLVEAGPAVSLLPAWNPFTLIADNPFKRMLADGFMGSPFAGASSPPGAGGSVRYLNFTYAPSSVAMPGEDGLYSTGEQWGGKTIYVSSKLAGPDKVPRTIFIKGDDGSYSSYTLSEVPAVYAYTLYGAFNTAEAVTFGMANDHGGDMMLNNAAPWVIQQKANGQWKTVYSPIAAEVLTPLDQGNSTEWSWDQKLNDGTLAPWGEYRVLVQGKYAAPFRIDKGSPTVEYRFTTYDNATANEAFGSPPQVKAFSDAYSASAYSSALRDELVSQMQFKAWMRGLDAAKLKSSIASTSEYASGNALPCLAVYSRYNNQPAWFIVFSRGAEAGAASHPLFYVISDAGKQLCTYICK